MNEQGTLLYGGIYSGDWVVCSNCGEIMLLPHGADKCPECKKAGCLGWASEYDIEHEVHRDYLRGMGAKVKSTFKDLLVSDYLDGHVINLPFSMAESSF